MSKIAPLMHMLFEAEQAKLRPILEHEAQLRRDLAQLSAHEAANRSLPAAHRDTMRPIGADVTWEAWLGRTRVELNRQLALCLAKKEHYLVTLRRAHGRKIAAETVLREDRRRESATCRKRECEIADALALLRQLDH